MDSMNTICFDSLRIYRDAVVQHIRSTMKEFYPNEWQTKLQAPFQKEWEAIKEASDVSRKTGQIGVTLTDDFDLLGVNHFHNLFDAHYDLLFPDATVSAEVHKQRKQNMLHWAKSINMMRNVVTGHPGEEDAG